ncbi:putative plastid-lipid-associated protein 12, chloroplastic [Morella rubra]|uniref:Putative plastid-lipid-associated protein 12, chloroplastic n=1 Tax=Morella rubra TaxID=262757 RepID=A0A6A1WW46_9ROSI|nr:putative plastid-lipid-associated protein 12, chloroplastic [Morella rubra]
MLELALSLPSSLLFLLYIAMALKVYTTNLGFQWSPRPTLSPMSSSRTFRCKSPNLFDSNCRSRRNVVVNASNLADEQQQVSFTGPENQLIEALLGIQGRGRSASPQQLNDVERAVQVLEGLGGVPDPTNSSLIEGQWQLIFTTRPQTASPIQRTFVGVDVFRVFQEVYLRTNDPRVSNIIRFSDSIGELKVEAAASVKDGKRILFRFDQAAFTFKFLPFKVPYPVPFKLLGDEAKGWLDTTYLSHSGDLRISRGNKGTTFVLQKKTEPRQRLLSAISTGTGVTKAIDDLISLHQNPTTNETELQDGEWRMIWSSQIVKNGQIKFLVDILLGLRFSMIGRFVYCDDKIRVSRGFNNIVFVHLKMDRSNKK